MKIGGNRRSSARHGGEKKRRPRGFALIASLALLALLALLACGMLAQICSLERVSGHNVLVAQARQQALVGLDAAIAELQEATGPDRRITASSALLEGGAEPVPPHLLGVWDSWGRPLYGKTEGGGVRRISDTYSPGRKAMFRRWLISARDMQLTRRMEAAAQLSNRRPGERICLLGAGTLGKDAPSSHHVYADLLYMPLEHRRQGGFAWWVTGENQKAKLAVQHEPAATHPAEALRRTWNTPGALPTAYPVLRTGLERTLKADTLLTRASLALLAKGAQPAGQPYFADYTTCSYSLLTNAAHGGLKQDLCLLLNKESLDNTPFAPTEESDAPLVPESWLPERRVRMPIGSWQTLHAYYNCWPNGSRNDAHITPRLIGTLPHHYTRLGGSVFDSNLRYDGAANGAPSSYLDLRSRQKGNEGAGYARNPVMLAYLCNLAMGTYQMSDADYRLSIYYSPLFLWWNPYNVPMRIGGRRMWAVAAPFKTMALSSYAGLGAYIGARWAGYGILRRNECIMPGMRRIPEKEESGMSCLDGGEFFQNSLYRPTEDIVFQPGEILVFTPGKKTIADVESKHAANAGTVQTNEPGSNPWLPGYRVHTVAEWYSPMYQLSSAPDPNSRGNVFGLSLNVRQHRLTDGLQMAGGRPECITVAHGFGGMAPPTVAPHPLDAEVPDISSETGKHIQSPQRFLMAWFNPDIAEGSCIITNPLSWQSGGAPGAHEVPYFAASIGIVPKSANAALDTKVYPGRDFRTKMWQHSSPAFWGATLHHADHQQRQYHPYQFAALSIEGGMLSFPISTVGRNGMLGVTTEGEQVSFAAVAELPVHPPFSLAGLAGMRLHPGWFRTPGGADATRLALQRMQYQSGVPGVGIGNSFADPCLPPDAVYCPHGAETTPKEHAPELWEEFYDHALLINDALWDRWFCSSVSDMPGNGPATILRARDTLERFLRGQGKLPVSRYVKAAGGYDSQQLLRRLLRNDGWKIIAAHLMIDGGFNVNSTSVEAWNAVLQGLANRPLVTAENGRLRFVEARKKRSQVAFSRFMLSTTDQSTDSVPQYSPMRGSESFRADSTPGAAAWSEVRLLDAAAIRQLAEEMVRQVRARGPFLSMSDFINRRLDPKGGEHALKGALQAAIDNTDINRAFSEINITPQEGSFYRFPEAEKGPLHTAAPGYLIQSDVLASLGNILTVRDDTFTVRAYGCVRNARNAVLAQCWCEATVQRTPDYVDPSDAPTAAEFSADLRHADKLSPLNRRFGRRFRITSFKWLDYWDL